MSVVFRNCSSRLLSYSKLINGNTFLCQRNTSVSAAVPKTIMSEKKYSASRLDGQKPSVWVEFIQLALEVNPVNLGQGFPDYAPPNVVTDALRDASVGSEMVRLHQYTRGFGHPRLVKALSNLYSQLTNRTINPNTEVLVTVGAYEALYCAFMGLVNPGDEVIIIEPFFDCYEPMVSLAGGKSVFIPLQLRNSSADGHTSSADWILDPVELRAKFSHKTKMIVVNTPHNPLGKVFSREELMMIRDLCIEFDVIALMDEVYEWLVYPGKQHVRMNTLPDMWDRTITVGSAGKTFSVTGWKTGWAYGPEHLLRPLQLIHQNTVYTCPTIIQEAIAVGLEKETARMGQPDCYWTQLAQELVIKRDRICSFLQEVSMKPTIPEGGYFLLADFSALGNKIDLSGFTGPKDYQFAKWLSRTKKLQGIPPSAFYSESHKDMVQDYIRFCFFKEDTTLKKAEEIIKGLKNNL